MDWLAEPKSHTTEGDPGNARIRFDNATPASVTALFVDDFDTAGIDVSGILNALPVGTRIYLQQQDVSGNFLIGTTTAITDNTGWFKIELTVTDSGTLPANNKIVGVLFFAGGAAAPVPSDMPAGHADALWELYGEIEEEIKEAEEEPDKALTIFWELVDS